MNLKKIYKKAFKNEEMLIRFGMALILYTIAFGFMKEPFWKELIIVTLFLIGFKIQSGGRE